MATFWKASLSLTEFCSYFHDQNPAPLGMVHNLSRTSLWGFRSPQETKHLFVKPGDWRRLQISGSRPMYHIHRLNQGEMPRALMSVQWKIWEKLISETYAYQSCQSVRLVVCWLVISTLKHLPSATSICLPNWTTQSSWESLCTNQTC